MSWTIAKPFSKPPNMSSKFMKLIPAEKEELAKKGRCFYYRKIGQHAVNYHLKKFQYRIAIGTITYNITEVTYSRKISSAAQVIVEHGSTPLTKGNSSQPHLIQLKKTS